MLYEPEPGQVYISSVRRQGAFMSSRSAAGRFFRTFLETLEGRLPDLPGCNYGLQALDGVISAILN